MMKKVFFYCLSIPFIIQAQEISFQKEIKNDSIYYHLINDYYTPYEISLKFKDNVLKNKISYRDTVVVQSKDTLRNFFAIPIYIYNNTINMNDHLQIKGIIGDPSTSKHATKYLYRLPFKKNKPYKVTQGFNGKKSHFSIKSKYAIDFNLKIGDTVYAAREGIVAITKKDFNEYGDIKYIEKANRIVIFHDDGTTASYVHLDYQGVFVQPGEYIEKGQPIGISGLTGYTSGPHLHFVVREARDVSVLIYFEGYASTTLKKGKKYKRKY